MPPKFTSLVFFLTLVSASSAEVQAPPLAEAPAAEQAGLILTFTTPDGKQDTRHSRLMALLVPEGQPPTPFLPAGPFTARWEGEIRSPLRAEYTFSAVVEGAFKFSVNDAPVLDNANASAGKQVRLNKGGNRVVAELVRPEKGDALLQLKWSSREFPAEPVPPVAFVHDSSAAALRLGTRAREGRLLFAQMRCAACHDAGSLLPPAGEGMPELTQDAPLFTDLASKYHENWLAHWINDPHAIRPRVLMPKVFASKAGEVAQAAADLAAYFASLGGRNDTAPEPALAAEGGALYANLGCIACHPKPDADRAAGANDDRVPLSHVRAKWQTPALEAWLKDPTANYKWNRMPHFRLSDSEAKRLAAYLLTTAKGEFSAGAKGDPARGAPLLVTSGCLNCHAGMPPTNQPKLEATLAGGWMKGCMAPDENARGKAPDFRFTAAQREALLAFASLGLASLKQDALPEFAERQIANQRCIACHARDAEGSTWAKLGDEIADLQSGAPVEEGEGKPVAVTNGAPPLTWLGEKLHPQWMGEFIAGAAKEKPRPWLIARMPGFPAVGEPLARGLSHEHGFRLNIAPVVINPEFAKAGETLLGENGGFNCTSCHHVGSRLATAVFEAPGINLAYTPERLRHDYYLRWVLFPQRIDPDTKMPRFSDDEGRTPLTEHFEGKAVDQFDAIWQYLHSLKK
ncbi:MAG TPA: c-type cytochrome [Chthoniobacteraceae bacterium]|jgi:mono/diheme cytochrome c family protein